MVLARRIGGEKKRNLVGVTFVEVEVEVVGVVPC